MVQPEFDIDKLEILHPFHNMAMHEAASLGNIPATRLLLERDVNQSLR